VPFHPPAAGKGTQCEKTGELEPSDLSKLRVTAEIFTGFKSPTDSGSLQAATPAVGSGFRSPAVLFETILCPTNSTTSLHGASLGEVAITETQEQHDSRSSCLLPKEQILKRGSKRSYMKGRCIIQVGNVAHRFKLCESVTVGFILEDLSASNAQLACKLEGATIRHGDVVLSGEPIVDQEVKERETRNVIFAASAGATTACFDPAVQIWCADSEKGAKAGEYVLTAIGKVKRDEWILAENNKASRVLCIILMKVKHDHAMFDVCADLLTCMHAAKTPGARRWSRAQNYGSPAVLRGNVVVNLVIEGGANIHLRSGVIAATMVTTLLTVRPLAHLSTHPLICRNSHRFLTLIAAVCIGAKMEYPRGGQALYT